MKKKQKGRKEKGKRGRKRKMEKKKKVVKSEVGRLTSEGWEVRCSGGMREIIYELLQFVARSTHPSSSPSTRPSIQCASFPPSLFLLLFSLTFSYISLSSILSFSFLSFYLSKFFLLIVFFQFCFSSYLY